MPFEQFPAPEPEPAQERREKAEEAADNAKKKSGGLSRWAKKTAALAGVAALGLAGGMKEAKAAELPSFSFNAGPKAGERRATSARKERTETRETSQRIATSGRSHGVKFQSLLREREQRTTPFYAERPASIKRTRTIGFSFEPRKQGYPKAGFNRPRSDRGR